MIRTLLLWFGIVCLGYCAYTIGMENLNQSYDNWVFEQHIAWQIRHKRRRIPSQRNAARLSRERYNPAANARPGSDTRTPPKWRSRQT